MTFIPSEDFGVNLVRNTPDGELHAGLHMDLCRAIDTIKLAVVLGKMVHAGGLSPRQRDAFAAQAGGLLATMLAENARAFIGSPHQSTMSSTRLYEAHARRARKCPCCKRQFRDGEPCTVGGCPMRGDF